MNGGYINIDCKGLELTSQSAVTVSGIYAEAKAAYETGKAIFAANCKWAGYYASPISVMVNPRGSGNFIATSSILQLEIGTDDEVTIRTLVGNSATAKAGK